MKNKLFSKNLYIEGLSQLKTVGIVSGSIFAVFSLLAALSQTIEQTELYIKYETSLLDLLPFIFVVPCIVTPILMFRIFSFMFKRNRSDFYHSIPQTRSCIYLSFTLSALTYVVLQIIVCSVLGTLGALIVGYQLTDVLDVFLAIPNLLAITCLIASAILIAISVTGRLFSALTVAFMILFYPRIFYLIFSVTITETVTVVDDTHFLPNSLLKYNAFFTYDYSVLTFACTFGLALILGAFGLFLFKKKKSQTASYPTASKRAQSVIRVAFSSLLCAIGVSMIYSKVFNDCSILMTDEYYINFGNRISNITIVIIFVIALMAYFVYDIISNRSVKGILKAVKDLIYLGIVNVLIFAILASTTLIITSYNPKVENIKSVTILSEGDYNSTSEDWIEDSVDGPFMTVINDLFGITDDGFYDGDFDDEYDDEYDENRVDASDYDLFVNSKNVIDLFGSIIDKKITNKKAIKVICDAYNSTYSKRKIFKCKIEENGKTYYRDITFSYEQLNNLANSINYRNQDLAEKLEKISQNASNIYFWDNFCSDYYDEMPISVSLDLAAKKKIVKAAVEDIKNSKNENFCDMYLANLRTFDEYEDYCDVVCGMGIKTNDGKYYAFYISPFMTKTIDAITSSYNKYYKIKNENNKQMLNEFFKDLKSEKLKPLGVDDDIEAEVRWSVYDIYAFETAIDEEDISEKVIKNGFQKKLYNEIKKRDLDITKRNSKDDVAVLLRYNPENENIEGYYDQFIYIPKDICNEYFIVND